MRVTTQMLNESMRKAGLDIRRNSLLDYVNGNAQDADYLGTGSAKARAVTTERRERYESVAKSSAQLSLRIGALQSEKAAGAEKTDDTKSAEQADGTDGTKSTTEAAKLRDQIKALVRDYNSVYGQLGKTGSRVDAYYASSMERLWRENEGQLKELGITIDTKGTVTTEKEKLEKASPEALRTLFGASSSFLDQLGTITAHIEDNAAANLESSAVYSRYGSSGAVGASHYDSYR